MLFCHMYHNVRIKDSVTMAAWQVAMDISYIRS